MEDYITQVKQRPLKNVIKIQKQNIEMRLTHIQDNEKLFSIVMKNQQYLSKTLPWAKNYKSIDDATTFLNLMQKAHENYDQITYLIWDKNEIIGSIGYILRLENKEADIGYWLDQDQCGKGIMTDCAQSLIDYGFEDLKLETVFIKCIISNTKSANIAIRLGFEEVEQQKNAIQIENEWYDFRVFQLTKDKYLNAKQLTQL
ncbi:GNAT family acetyltransferase (macronuclear) [Tetrahymena thermophila SB210]|uniref:GNAT family acetyltransferase n=1 Tax=Tetrahymena thermophila (strain SB210) TaxID=312017 RepID=Q22KE7_TETTS|nr:GNAT family acetyltransferase [Tetrahymena thermophila SB210]EAR85852.1 GNAT family acetyltransferase [Tetrahymena thermophila SB210]|eukprot:XP_001033515.1 GNAT family acetyltransferase [Tetrahymena thermophila SB210]